MTLVACVEDRLGMLFHNRRLSSDRCVCERIETLSANTRLCVDAYSAKLFSGDRVHVSHDPGQDAQPGDILFAERSDFLQFAEKIERVVLYKWNRRYPYDKQFPADLLQNFHLLSIEDFSGSSHETVTQEVYIR